jgi:ectoine hydroxylase-related dioxygenase (phytanoyl-CoA dioxygenase family)
MEMLHPGGGYVGVDAVVLIGLPDDKRLAYDWHQESNYMPGLSPVVNFWFPVFEPATRNNGAMSVLVGSHRSGRLGYTKRRLANDSYTDLVPDGIDALQKQYTEYHCLAAPGDLVVFEADLIHRSNRNQTARTRFSGVVRLLAPRAIPETLSFSNELY